MAEFSGTLTDTHRAFIAKQPMFFVAAFDGLPVRTPTRGEH